MFFWGVIAVLLFIIDMLTSTALLLGFSISALIVAGVSNLIPNWSQALVFAVIGITLTLTLIPKLRKVPETKTYSDSLEGLTIKASTNMEAGTIYQEKVKGTFWNIKCVENIDENQKIKVIKVDKENNCLIMKGE